MLKSKLVVLVLLGFGISANAYALNLDKVKISMLKGDYKEAILEGEKILATQEESPSLDELYYLLGLSYMKDGNFLRASDIFEIILNEFPGSKFKEEAKLGLGDTFLFRNKLDKAQGTYEELLRINPNSKLVPQVYFRLSQIEFKKGNSLQGKEYLDKLRQEFPDTFELLSNQNISTVAVSQGDLYYTVQVGSFSHSMNAENMKQSLIQKGYPAYIEESGGSVKNIYRVRVGKLQSRQEALDLEKRLSQEGYPTKISP